MDTTMHMRILGRLDSGKSTVTIYRCAGGHEIGIVALVIIEEGELSRMTEISSSIARAAFWGTLGILCLLVFNAIAAGTFMLITWVAGAENPVVLGVAGFLGLAPGTFAFCALMDEFI